MKKRLEILSKALLILAENGTPLTGKPLGLTRMYMQEWTADGGIQSADSYVQYEGAGYKCINAIQRIATYSPNIAVNNYTPVPDYNPLCDAYHYVYGMSVEKDMRVIEIIDRRACIYKAAMPMTVLIHKPSELPAIFEKV